MPLPVLVFSTVVAAVAALGFRWSPFPRALVAFGVSALVTAVYPGPGDNTAATWLLLETVAQLCVLVQVARRSSVTLAVFGVAAVGVSPLRLGLWLTPPAPEGEVAGVCAVWTLLAAAAVGVGAYLRWLDKERARSVAAARREQRVRLAWDLHDWLAHEMTGIVLAAQAGQLDESDAVRTLGQIEEAGTRGLAAMDRALRLLRSATDEPADHAVTIGEVNEVVARFAETSTATVTCEIADLDTPRPEIVATVHRVVVESLTNVRRHAPNASEVLVRVTHTDTDMVVEVTNEGGGRPPKRGRRGGTGLAGLAEWVGALDGTLTAGPATRHGWTVRAVVPA
ncbi:sensor histidine kinase [Actinophytocola sp.]|uniref:sensor histidine kinase n=1 Tax=Actinophytocola sp. TaxID=1872138 RepID=UPI002ED03773